MSPNQQPPCCQDCPVRQIALCGQPPDDPHPPLASQRRELRRAGSREVLGLEWRPLREFAVLRHGWAARYHVLPDGRRQILSFALPGEPLVIEGLASQRQPYAVKTLTDVELCSFDIDLVRRRVAGESVLAAAYLKQHANYNRRLYRRLTALGRATARQRLAGLLLELLDRLGAQGLTAADKLPFPLRQWEVADALGLTPVHVSRVFREFVQEGVARRDGQQIALTDLPRLHAIAAGIGLDPDAAPVESG